MTSTPHAAAPLSRRSFLKASAAAAAGTSLGLRPAPPRPRRAADLIRVGLVGCGGRGTGAARDAAVSAPDVEVVAMGDLFADRLDRSRELLAEHIPDQYKATDATCFSGFDAYQRVLEQDIDVVILAAPPGFRPMHVQAAVDAGRHIFMEKPAAVDVAGIHAILAAGEQAHQQGLSIVAGTLYRRQPSFSEAVQRIHDGMIGQVTGAEAYYMTGPIWLRPRKPGMSDMEWQCRNWYYFTWLSGDHIVEQFVHNLDVMHWVFQGPPVSAIGMGGRLVRVDPSYGHIYDHFSIEYEYASGARLEAKCRQMEGCTSRVTNRVVGTEGVAELHPGHSVIRSHRGEVRFEHPERGNNAYVQEHTDLIESIRSGQPINEAVQIAESTMMAILGRESAYTGQSLTWDEIMATDLDLAPPAYTFGPLPMPQVEHPGLTL